MPKPRLTVEGFMARTDQSSSDCWLWMGRLDADGYGRVWWPKNPGDRRGTTRIAHRVSYELKYGAIPDGLQLDHLCRVRRCVNPDHLEPVTNLINQHRSPIAPSALNARKTHCKHGHEFTPRNTRLWTPPGSNRPERICRTCVRIRSRRYARERVAS